MRQFRAGHRADALATLRRLLAQHPDDAPLRADLLVLLHDDGRDAAAVEVGTLLSAAKAPRYALLPWARALRNQHDYARAIRLLAPNLRRVSLGWQGILEYALVLADGGHPREAERQIRIVLAIHPHDAEVWALAAYVARRAGHPARGLRRAAHALRLSPQNRTAIREKVFDESALGMYHAAWQTVRQHRTLFSAREVDQVRGDRNAAQVRWGDTNPTVHPASRYAETDRAIFNLNWTLDILPRTATAQRHRAEQDLVVALRDRHRPCEAIRLYRHLRRSGVEPPIYVVHAAADAYYARHRLKTAIRLYRRVLKQDPDDYNARTSLFYAYTDDERYDKAMDELQTLRGHPPGIIETKRTDSWNTSWLKLNTSILTAYAQAYANHNASARKQLEYLGRQAPGNAGLHFDLAQIDRWRGWPRAAMQQVHAGLATETDPYSKSGQLAVANTARDLNDYPLWGHYILPLYALYPDDGSVRNSWLGWQDRDRYAFSTNGQFGYSPSVSNQVFGQHDRAVTSRVTSPWFGNWWRLYANQQYSFGQYTNGSSDFNRLGVGIDWRRLSQHAYLGVSGDVQSGQPGVSLGYDDSIDDFWSWGVNYDSFSTDTPLRALRAGYTGWDLNASATYRASDTFKSSLSLERLAIGDGNVRLSALSDTTQRVQASPHHLTWLTFELYTSHARLRNAAYFNPANDLSASFILHHDWVTWRFYHHSLTQRFYFTLGEYWQQDFGTGPFFGLRYVHRWRLDRVWYLDYGIGWTNYLYDGAYNPRFYGLFGLQGLF